ncbi:heterokaryon incompatibility protein [Colletotrichum higginsianum]|uniref:Heterokaryon incompatibility protein 6, OR allele n=1 Tax=Colletotrichum higginsianum TaxID=80884 RepID=A0A4T0VHC5_9PEZI|nr:Heterokaryon incompatibility protein 6, OR allele [Colletotrichum higginsianum]GJC97750.1 heterokaryon incompatibility protein [Colletotrichum higginsianum]
MKKYQYSPLTVNRQIRLLKLNAGAEAEELSGELVHTPLDGTPSFTAVSYVWGNPQPRKGIFCSGLKMEIGPSLHSALLHLRQPACETYLWADALCINQEDILERNQQVRMMGDIYAAASSTAIWLGEESCEVKMAVGWLRRFAVAWDSLESDPGFITRNQAEGILQEAFGKKSEAAFQHIWALLNRPWFARKWVIQELVKSQRPILVVGRVALPWAMLADWLNFVEWCPNVKELFMRFCPTPLEAGAKVLGLTLLRASLLMRCAVPEKKLLLFLIVRTLEFRCADPRDHIFAMVGIASDADRFDLIDYGSPMEKVCRQLAYSCVSDSMSLKLLWSLVYLAPLKSRVRSWLPNIERVLEDRDGSILASQFSVQQYKDYNASGDTVLQAHLDDGGDTLRIRGRLVDKVRHLGSDNRSLGDARIVENMFNGNLQLIQNNIQTMLRRRWQWLEECLAIAKTSSTTNAEEAFQNALLGDSLINKEVPQSLAVVKSEFSTQIHLYKVMAYENDFISWLSAIIASMSLESSHVLESMILEKLHRRFGRTENGRIGWLPPIAEEGDFICVFDGMELPYAIRPASDGRYLLLGECIILGLMSGEAVGISGVVSEFIILQ